MLPWLRRLVGGLSTCFRWLVASLSPWFRRLVTSVSPWFRRLVASLSPRRLRCCSQALWHVVDKVTLCHVFLCHHHCINAACCTLFYLSPLAEGPNSGTGIREKRRKIHSQMGSSEKEGSFIYWYRATRDCYFPELTDQLHKQLTLRTEWLLASQEAVTFLCVRNFIALRTTSRQWTTFWARWIPSTSLHFISFSWLIYGMWRRVFC